MARLEQAPVQQAPSPPAGRVALEIGGTFADIVWTDATGSLRSAKVPARQNSLSRSIAEALDVLPQGLGNVTVFVHGSTIATNALIERRGGVVGLVTTSGFRDVLEIGTHDRVGDPYTIRYWRPEPLVPRHMVAEVAERIRGSGEIEKPLCVEEALAEVDRLIASGMTSLAISLLNSYANDSHERTFAAHVRSRHPGLAVSLGSRVSPGFREYQRTVTTAVNALVLPPVSQYLVALGDELKAREFSGELRIVQSSGGVVDAAGASDLPVKLLLSGPAAGVRAALHCAARNGIENVITFDMGGTSTDVSLAESLRPRTVSELSIDGVLVRTAAIDIATVGAGGGSIARLDANGLLSIGPDSAGADPGPACYGLGGELPTVTDAQVVTGLLRAERRLGGVLAIHAEAAGAAIARVGIEGTLAEVADAVLRIAVARMASAVRLVSTARGADPSAYTLVAYGGGGPIHAAHVAEDVGIHRVLVPLQPGAASAFGLLVSDLLLETEQPVMSVLDDTTLGGATMASIRDEAGAAAIRHGLTEPVLEIGLDLRYVGQAFEIIIWFPVETHPAANVAEAFNATHAARYGYRRDGTDIFTVNRRLRLTEVTGKHRDIAPPWALDPEPRSLSEAVVRHVRIGGADTQARFIAREMLAVGQSLTGPAVIEETTSTTVIPPGWQAEVTPAGDILMVRST